MPSSSRAALDSPEDTVDPTSTTFTTGGSAVSGSDSCHHRLSGKITTPEHVVCLIRKRMERDGKGRFSPFQPFQSFQPFQPGNLNNVED